MYSTQYTRQESYMEYDDDIHHIGIKLPSRQDRQTQIHQQPKVFEKPTYQTTTSIDANATKVLFTN